jgi:glycosyltransferase involved in cell wall biosynthesis
MTHVSERESWRTDAPVSLLAPEPDDERAGAPPQLPLSVLIPTRNEAGNVEALIERLSEALEGLPAEAIFVDDSDDCTPEVIAAAAARRSPTDRLQVSLLHRSAGARDGGLGGAVVAGLAQAQGTWVCVMDGDLQHPPETILLMLAAAESRDATFVVASRYREGGDSAGLACVTRRVLSRAASGAANALFWRALRRVSDPMSGFFLFRRDLVDRRMLRPEGFKILLEIALRTPGLRITEVPYTFEERHAGESKANRGEAVAYARHLARLRVDLARQRVLGARP